MNIAASCAEPKKPLFSSDLSMADAAKKRESSSERVMPACKYPRLETRVTGRDENKAVMTLKRSRSVPERVCFCGSATAEKDPKKDISQEDVPLERIKSEVEAPRAILDCELSHQTANWARLLERGETRMTKPYCLKLNERTGVNEIIQLAPFRPWEFDHMPTAVVGFGIRHMRHGAEGEESCFRHGSGSMARASNYGNATPTSCKELANEAVLTTVACCHSSGWNAVDDLQSTKRIPSSCSVLESTGNFLEYDKEQSLESLPRAAFLFVQIFAMAAERLLPLEDQQLPIDRHLSVIRYLREQWCMLDQGDRRYYAEAAEKLREDHFEPSNGESDSGDPLSLFATCLFATDEDAQLYLNENLSLDAYMQYSAESIDDDQSSWYTETLQTHSQIHVDFETTLIRSGLFKTQCAVPD